MPIDQYTLEFIKTRFFKSVRFLPNGCWEWIGYKMKPIGRGAGGYGTFTIGKGYGTMFAHQNFSGKPLASAMGRKGESPVAGDCLFLCCTGTLNMRFDPVNTGVLAHN